MQWSKKVVKGVLGRFHQIVMALGIMRIKTFVFPKLLLQS